MVIAISNQKGGVGKTTLTFNLGYLLAEKGKKTLLIDADPQGSLTTIFNQNDRTSNIYGVLLDKEPIKEKIVSIEKGLDFLPGGIQLADFEVNVANKKGRENYFKNMIAEVAENYDYILIDSPPSLGLLLVNILNAIDKLIIPTQTDYLSYRGLDLLLHTVARVKDNLNPTLKILGVVATGFDVRTLHAKEILELMEGMDMLGIISNSVKVKDAVLEGQPLHRYDKGHKIAREYTRIAKEIMKHGK